MEIHVLTAIWKRPEITDIFFKGIKRLGLNCTAVISEDIDLPCQTVFAENQPLGNKWNRGLERAMENEFDYLLILGSDDLISNCLLDKYKGYNGVDMIGVKDFYMYDIQQKRVKYFAGYNVKYNRNISIGAGRLIRRDIIERLGRLWHPRQVKGLDSHCSKVLRVKGYQEIVIPMGDSVVVDIKSGMNMNGFDDITGEEVPLSVLKKIPEL